MRDFYAQVTGWTVQPVKMGKYEDYSMLAASGKPSRRLPLARSERQSAAHVADLHRGRNLDAALQRCRELGGEVLNAGAHGQRLPVAVIKDPAGACAALWEPAEAA